MDAFDRLVLGIAAVLIALTGGVIALGDRVGVQVIEYTPGPDSHPAITSPITISFDLPMETDSVEASFSLQPDTGGSFNWQDNTLVFTPDQVFQSGETYKVSIGEGALSTSGRKLQPLDWSFTPRDPGILYLAPTDVQIRSLWFQTLDDSPQQEVLRSDYGVFDFAPRPDGEQIAVMMYTAEGSSDIWLINPDGSEPEQLTDCSPGICTGPVWSPDGRQIAYERAEIAPNGGLGPTRVWVLNLASGETGPVYADNQVLGYGPVWSPDGGSLAFFDANQGQIRVLELQTGEVAFVESNMGEVGVFSPDGSRMLFTNIRKTDQQFFTGLYLIDFEKGGSIRDLLDEPQEDQWPSWSPDGRWIAFSRRPLDREASEFAGQFMLLDTETGDIRQVTGDATYNSLGFVWSPDSRYVLFTRFNLEERMARSEIWLYDNATPESDPVLVVENASGGQWLP